MSCRHASFSDRLVRSKPIVRTNDTHKSAISWSSNIKGAQGLACAAADILPQRLLDHISGRGGEGCLAAVLVPGCFWQHALQMSLFLAGVTAGSALTVSALNTLNRL